jgi:hypothetical protein
MQSIPQRPTRTIARPQSRVAACAILTERIKQRYWPRTNAFFIALVTAGFAALLSALLWRMGMEAMSWRYPVSVMLSYLILLTLLWAWSHRSLWDGSNFDLPNVGSPNGNASSGGTCHNPDFVGSGGEFGGAGASGSFDVGIADSGVSAGDIVSGGVEAAVSAEEGAVVVVPILLMIGLVFLMGGFAFSTVALVWQAPALLAQLMIDAGTAGLLLVCVRPQDRHEWLTTAVRKTLPAFAMLALVFAIAGFALEWFDPEAITLFDVLANRSAN